MKQTGSEKCGELKQTAECTSSPQVTAMTQGQVIIAMKECKLRATRYSDFSREDLNLIFKCQQQNEKNLKYHVSHILPTYENISLYHLTDKFMRQI